MNVLVLVNVPENMDFLFRVRSRLRARSRGVLPRFLRDLFLPEARRRFVMMKTGKPVQVQEEEDD